MPSNPETQTEDYQLLPTGPQAADEDPQKADMGLAEQLEKAEGRQGDNFARYAALVRSIICSIPFTKLIEVFFQGASAVRGSEKKDEESPILSYIRLHWP